MLPLPGKRSKLNGTQALPLQHNGARRCPSPVALICDVVRMSWSQGCIFYVRNVEVGGSSPLTSTPKAQVMPLIASPYRPESYALCDSTGLNCVLWTTEGGFSDAEARRSTSTRPLLRSAEPVKSAGGDRARFHSAISLLRAPTRRPWIRASPNHGARVDRGCETGSGHDLTHRYPNRRRPDQLKSQPHDVSYSRGRCRYRAIEVRRAVRARTVVDDEPPRELAPKARRRDQLQRRGRTSHAPPAGDAHETSGPPGP